MYMDIDYGNIGRTRSLDTSIESRLKKVLARSSGYKNAFVKVWVNKVVSSIGGGLPLYKVAIRIRKGKRKEIYVEKKSASFQRCLMAALFSLKYSIRRTQA